MSLGVIVGTHSQADGRKSGFQGTVAVGGTSVSEAGLFAADVSGGSHGRFHDGSVLILSAGVDVADMLYFIGDGILTPALGFFPACLLDGIEDPSAEFFQFLLGVGTEVEADGGGGDDGMNRFKASGMEAKVVMGSLGTWKSEIFAMALAAA